MNNEKKDDWTDPPFANTRNLKIVGSIGYLEIFDFTEIVLIFLTN